MVNHFHDDEDCKYLFLHRKTQNNTELLCEKEKRGWLIYIFIAGWQKSNIYVEYKKLCIFKIKQSTLTTFYIDLKNMK